VFYALLSTEKTLNINPKLFIDKLDDTSRQALEGAAALCVARSHYDVEIEHFLMKLLDQKGGDFASIAKAFSLDTSRMASQLLASLDRLKSGNARKPFYAPTLVAMLSAAWTIASLEFKVGKIRTGFAVLALRTDDELIALTVDASPEFQKIDAAQLRQQFAEIVRHSYESQEVAPLGSESLDEEGQEGPPAAQPGTRALNQYTINLTENARAGKIDPVLARDSEIRQVIDILTRRRQNNPILVGEAGVGKTAVVEGFALRVVNGDVPAPLRTVTLRALDLALLQAGAGVKGEFENRLKSLIQEIKNSPAPIILFIDEAHTMIGAGGQPGQSDAANLLKPALARGELRTVAATTWSEYKKYFEKDPALARRFQVVKVEEPTEDACLQMMRGVVPALESHHQVRILDEGLAAAVTLSRRYLPDRQLPDKAVSVLDTACARLALGQATVPPTVEATQRRIEDLAAQERILRREKELGADHSERLNQISECLCAAQEQLQQLQQRWEKESNLVAEIRDLHTRIETSDENPKRDDLRAGLAKKNEELEELQGESGLIRVCVDAPIIQEVISGWTGIPVGKMLKNELDMVLDLERHLGSRIIGQGHALHAISERILTTRANMDDPAKPVGVFLLVGPSGVGKTETALALSDILYGGEDKVIAINMSEFKESHTISTLKGAPPGYTGFGQGGRLTEAIRRRPYSVVLLDEIEKAHADVQELFFQVFDKGRMEDGEGREIIFRNAIIILTSNSGTETIMRLTADPETAPGIDGMVKALKPELDKTFKPAFLGRTVIIPYLPIRDENLRRIVGLKIAKIQRRLKETHHIDLMYDETLIDAVISRCTEVESGARNVDNILTNSLLPGLSRRLLALVGDDIGTSFLRVTVDDSNNFVYS
jgi:type VI secretion system protein VasG